MAAPDRMRESELHRADLPDHPGAWDLNQRTVGRWADKVCVGAEVSHCPVIGDIGAAIRAEPDVERAVECVRVVDNERLVASVVAGEVLNPQRKGRARHLVEVDQLDLMADFRSRRGGVGRRETEIASSEYSAAPGRTGPRTKTSGTKSMPVNDESAPSFDRGCVIC